MKRILALALVAGALLLGGCGRQHAAPPAGAPAAAPAATERAATADSATAGLAAAGSTSSSPAASSSSDVDSLLGNVDKQLNSDDQTPADQD